MFYLDITHSWFAREVRQKEDLNLLYKLYLAVAAEIAEFESCKSLGTIQVTSMSLAPKLSNKVEARLGAVLVMI